MESIDKRTCALSIVGMAFVWAPLHTSGHYPLSLVFTSQTAPVAEISAYHIVYTIAFVLVAAILMLARRRVQEALDRSRTLPFACAAVGLLGSGLLAASPLFAGSSSIAVGVCMVLTALSTASLLIAWGSRMASFDTRSTALCVTGSYLAFSALWLACALANIETAALLVIAPVINGGGVGLLAHAGRRAWVFDPSALKELPYGFVAPCLIFVYFGIICVKALTAMQIGISVGALSNLHLVVTAAAGLVICMAVLALFRAKGYAQSTLVLVFALLVLCYMASLLAVMLGLDSDYQSFLGKRALVGSEHVIEALLFIMLACTAHEKRLSPVLGFGLFATLVVAVPQFIASDLMYQTGLLGALSHLDLVVPLVAVASFAIAAVAIGLLVRVSTRAAQAPAMPAGNWQEELCRTALGSLDLSPREFDVAVLAYRGYSAKKIASTLYVSESTVKTHTSHVYRKVGIHSKQELIAFIDAFRTEG